MQFSTALLGLLAASGALAAPAADASSANSQVTVILRGPSELATQTQLGKNEQKRPIGAGSDFTSVELAAHKLKNDKGQDLRCRVFDARGRPITVTRGANVDTTFSDAGKGEWTFKKTVVSKVQCSTAFVAAPKKRDVEMIEERANGPLRVTLSGPSELATQTGIGEKDAKAPVGSRGPYNQVTLNVGSGRKEARCQLIDTQNKVITLVRGANVDVTFGDAGKGPWKAQNGKTFNVKEIKCDPSFKSRN
ncbi:hypothetical protein PG996_015031 [Apiospora saccharicola]|uniref:Uncharacterized protein n=1 Tax=Apiospora saccharicola TaxID=335842 RepID=A0ABR1TK49_9PEZI